MPVGLQRLAGYKIRQEFHVQDFYALSKEKPSLKNAGF